ncbi:hypothetical protein GNI_138630 [Gregarina niphandrodes]|uniref:Uncharacterized protein n=1 Tax=Gregarina niphandrodes TaxID=110365 RepID=A0A023B0L7_GRENI|nr:hypothetical protein GNI_138630 [Gregarina niphandrodes]EZG45428.1 hypothetical protein GNI_138630 [Gregarina niphandrodes]|eukprot:XP_011132504.1 hypothetical protein GNI_138630 [Gregarina niphandrodes]
MIQTSSVLCLVNNICNAAENSTTAAESSTTPAPEDTTVDPLSSLSAEERLQALQKQQVTLQNEQITELNHKNEGILKGIDQLETKAASLEQRAFESPTVQSVLEKAAASSVNTTKHNDGPIHIFRYIQNTFAQSLQARRLAEAEKASTPRVVVQSDQNSQLTRAVERAKKNEEYYIGHYKSKEEMEEALKKMEARVSFQTRAARLEEESIELDSHLTRAQKASRLQRLELRTRDMEHEYKIMRSALRNWDALQST